MPAQSKQQQKFMGMVHALKKGDMDPSDASPELKKAADSMNDTDAKDFASTPHKGLPKRVKQEIVRKLKEYAMTLPGHHSQPPAPMDSLRPNYEMDLQKETRIPQNFNVGTTQDYHTKLATTPRKKYDKTNFDPEHSGQEDLEEAFSELEHLKLLNLAMKAMPGSPKQKEIIKKLNQVRIAGGMQPLKEISVDTIHKLADKKGIKWDNEPSFLKLTKQLTGKEHLDDLTTPELIKVKQYLEKQSDSTPIKEAGLKGVENIPSNKKLSQLSDNEKLSIIQSVGNIISFHVPDWAKGRYKFWQVISAGKVKKGKSLSGETQYFLQGKGPQKASPTYKSVKDLINGVDWDTMEMRRESVNEGCWKGYKAVGGKMKNGKMVPNCVPESVNESADTTSLKKIHDAVFKFLKTKKGVGEVKEFPEFPNRYGDNVSTFSVKYNIEDKYNYDLQEIKIEYSTSRVFIPNKGYFSFKTFNDIKNIINKKSSLKEYASNLDNSYILNKDAKLDGTPEDKKAIGEELSFDEREMVIGIIEILKQVEDRKNRMKIALNMLKKFKEEGIEFDYQKFIDSLKEYSMGSYEYDRGNRELGEAMIMQAKDVIYKVIPKRTFARYAANPPKNREFVDSIIKDFTQVLNRFYKQNDIDLVLR